MIEKRRNKRIECFTKCILCHNDSKYWCVLENISFTGALVRLNGAFPNGIHSGDECTLSLLYNEPILSPGEFKSRIIHLTSPKIGLHFLEQETPDI